MQPVSRSRGAIPVSLERRQITGFADIAVSQPVYESAGDSSVLSGKRLRNFTPNDIRSLLQTHRMQLIDGADRRELAEICNV